MVSINDFCFFIWEWESIYDFKIKEKWKLWGCRIVWCTLNSFPFISVYNSCVLYFPCWFLKLRNKFYYVGLPGLGLAGGQDSGFSFPWNGRIPRPHRVTWSQPINMHPVKSPRESWKARGRRSLNKSPRCLYQYNCFKFEQKPTKFVPIRLLCKHVTNHFVTRM